MIAPLLTAVAEPTTAEIGMMVRNFIWCAGAVFTVFKLISWLTERMPSRRVQDEHEKRIAILEEERRYSATDEARYEKHLKMMRQWIEKHGKP